MIETDRQTGPILAQEFAAIDHRNRHLGWPDARVTASEATPWVPRRNFWAASTLASDMKVKVVECVNQGI